jgi:hypothetical protein
MPTHTKALRRRVSNTQPTPMPALAPVERPLDFEERSTGSWPSFCWELVGRGARDIEGTVLVIMSMSLGVSEGAAVGSELSLSAV